MGTEAATPEELDAVEARIDRWAGEQLAENPMVLAVDRGEPGVLRWHIRLQGEEKDVTTVWLTIHQRTLRYQTYVLPAPEENHAQFYEHLLRRNHGFNGAAFVIGDEDAVFLEGQLPLDAVDDDELDRVLGSLYAYVERCFRPALRIAFASRFPA
ncbi:YbjN domain-containing protein [Aquihabitans sp. G128]|uniref:YbjN domain-containing protein n=1 Tax=Aquihabitans sp. G128 TaxID=2849779 RepID=UPI001C22003D|nr:YbjN domain-containing protein [Aquihabitans sp. G128]QXC60134.1 YbjN domain-containing protein [Aquihabitans sp. G128]